MHEYPQIINPEVFPQHAFSNFTISLHSSNLKAWYYSFKTANKASKQTLCSFLYAVSVHYLVRAHMKKIVSVVWLCGYHIIPLFISVSTNNQTLCGGYLKGFSKVQELKQSEAMNSKIINAVGLTEETGDDKTSVWQPVYKSEKYLMKTREREQMNPSQSAGNLCILR